MPLVIPPGFANAAFSFLDAGSSLEGTPPYVITLGIDASGSTSPADVADNLFAAYVASLLQITSNEYELDKVTVTVSLPGGGTGSADSTAALGNGVADTDPTYSAIVAKVRKNTAQLGRKGRGVWHPPGLLTLDTVNTNGFVTSVKRAEIDDAHQEFVTELTTYGVVPVLLHTSAADAPTPIVSFSCATTAGVLRNRML